MSTAQIPPVPLQHAKVCLCKPDDIYEVGSTDANGQVTFSITPQFGGLMKVTVTRFHNIESDYDQYRPSQALCEVIPGEGGGGQSAGSNIIIPDHLCITGMPILVKGEAKIKYGVPEKNYGFSFTFDANNKPYFTNYCRDTSAGKTYLRCTTRDSLGWSIEMVDSSVGYLGNWYQDLSSSVDIDTFNHPGIAYIAWNVEDSLHYAKYAHFNGIAWDTAIVEYDSAFANSQVMPTDWSPSLRYSMTNVPYIAYHQIYNNHDTVKIAYFNDSLNVWCVNSVIIEPGGGRPVSMAINSQDYVCLAHGWGVDVAYTWWDGLSWHTETTGTTMGWSGIKIVLDLDSLDNPHILYRMDMHPVGYCYKSNSTWYINNTIGSTMGDISFALDDNNNPNVCFEFMNLDTTEIKHLRFTRGTFTGIEDKENLNIEKPLNLQLFPNPAKEIMNIRYMVTVQGDVELSLYDVTGAKQSSIRYKTKMPGFYQESLDVKDLASGIYFIEIKQKDESTSKKCILIK